MRKFAGRRTHAAGNQSPDVKLREDIADGSLRKSHHHHPAKHAVGFGGASWLVLLCIFHSANAAVVEARAVKTASAEPTNAGPAHVRTGVGFDGNRDWKPESPARHFQNSHLQSGYARARDLKFSHLTTNDGLSQGYVTAILQDRRGFMWFATRDGLNRYDGGAFLVYKSDPSDPHSLSSNFIQGLMEDNHGYLWLATNTGVDKFDPTTERFTRYLHDPQNPTSIGGALVKSIAQDSSGHIWLGTEDAGLDELDPTSGRFNHYRNDSDGHFVGRITQVIADRHGDIWFVGERGLFHLNPATGQITRQSAIRNGFSAESVYEDEAGNLWILIDSPVVELVKYDRQAGRFISYPPPHLPLVV